MNNMFVASVITALLVTNVTPVHAAPITKPETSFTAATSSNLSISINPNLDSPVATDTPVLVGVTVGAALVQDTVATPPQPKTPQETASEMVTDRFGAASVASFDKIVTHESNWNPNAVNTASGACGLGQALPCTKIADHSIIGQIQWMIDYIAGRYGTPAAAWYFWQYHHWY